MKRVLITVNPQLIKGKRFSTVRSMVTALDRLADLVVLPVDGYDYKKRLVRAYRRAPGGRFEFAGMVRPRADVWIVYTDGYYLDAHSMGFRRRKDLLAAQLEFHKEHLESGRIGFMANSPECERRTLKGWFAKLDPAKTRVIPTFVFSSFDEVHDYRKQQGRIVAKPDWGGDGVGVVKLDSEDAVKAFKSSLEQRADSDLSDYCFQPYMPGDEKRLWFAGGKFVGGRKCIGRKTPWSDSSDEYDVIAYDNDSQPGFSADLAAATDLARLADLSVGSVDFLGERINEINGCGTIFTAYRYWLKVVDARPALVKWVTELVKSSP